MAEAVLPVNILLVDDEPKNLVALESVLAGDDRDLVLAASGQEALRDVLRQEFAVILLDVHMPGMDGFETAELVRGREQSRDTPIIFLTAAVQEEPFVSRGYSLGAVDYIVKPFDPEALRSKVAVFVELFRQRKQVQLQAEQLAEMTAFLNSVLEGSTEYAIIAMDLHGGILTWNEGARRIYGYTAEEMISRANVRQLHTPEDVEAGKVDALLRKGTRGKVETELTRVRKSGRRFSASIALDQRKATDGHLLGFVSISRDVTQLKRAEEQRARLLEAQVARAEAENARDRLQQVVDVLPEAILIADATGRIFLSNAAAQEIIGGAPPANVSAYDAFDFREIDGSPQTREADPLARAILRGEVVSGAQLLVARGDGRDPIPVLVSSAPLRDARGEVAGGVVAFQDISSIKEIEREKDAFLAAASHDLKNPLTAIKARAQILERRAVKLAVPEASGLVDGLRAIDRTAQRVTDMINGLLDVARLQTGRPLDLDRQEMDLADLARQVAAELQPSTERHQIRVLFDPGGVRGCWDWARLERVLANLVSNAIKYSPDGGEITLDVGREGDRDSQRAVLRVRDQGVGIPAAELPRVFERYYRGSNVTGRIEGTGLGLAGVRQIVEQHGGTIAAESQERVGSTFTVRLPIEASVEQAATGVPA